MATSTIINDVEVTKDQLDKIKKIMAEPSNKENNLPTKSKVKNMSSNDLEKIFNAKSTNKIGDFKNCA